LFDGGLVLQLLLQVAGQGAAGADGQQEKDCE
jgi:hypothetical protein